ncbi:alpha/beta hydrolase [Thermodesulfatator atlanticus]|uniref:alpha/beta hydrolase n=1 Tax=Thermodesulfatator atlanticus TaxID=501497 RepID=UPI0003B56F55|nr:alpha/beta hydrolase [Thermodesulfatator atlanticus]
MERQTNLTDLIPKTPLESPPQGAEDVVIPLQGGSLPARLFLGSEKSPILFFFVAENDALDHYHDFAANILAHDISLVLIGYRGAHGCSGEVSFENIFSDAKEAFFALREALAKRGRKGPVSLLGRSLGAGVALYLAAEIPHEITALILDSPIIDGKMWLAKRNLNTESDPFKILENLKKWRKPLLIFQAQLDEETTLPEAEKLLIFCPGRNKRLLIMPGFKREETIEKGGPLYAETIAELLNRLASRFGRRRKLH